MTTYKLSQQTMMNKIRPLKHVCPSIKTQVCKHLFNRVRCKHHDMGKCKYVHDESEFDYITTCSYSCNYVSCRFFHPNKETKESYLKRVNLKHITNEYNPPRHLPCKKVSFHFEKDVLKPIIGINGCHFKYITEKTDVSYIWYDDDKKLIEIWGFINKIPFAEKLLFRHCIYIIGQIIKKNPSQIKNKKTIEWYNRCQSMMIP